MKSCFFSHSRILHDHKNKLFSLFFDALRCWFSFSINNPNMFLTTQGGLDYWCQRFPPLPCPWFDWLNCHLFWPCGTSWHRSSTRFSEAASTACLFQMLEAFGQMHLHERRQPLRKPKERKREETYNLNSWNKESLFNDLRNQTIFGNPLLRRWPGSEIHLWDIVWALPGSIALGEQRKASTCWAERVFQPQQFNNTGMQVWKTLDPKRQVWSTMNSWYT